MNLEEIAVKYGTDKQKANGHGYTDYYSQYFESIRNKSITLLELGVREGSSILTWHDYFPKATIWCIDNDVEGKCPKTFSQKRINFFFGSQDDYLFLKEVHTRSGDFDVVIDDASHISSLTIKSFEILFPLVKSGGLYIIEDLHVCGADGYNPLGTTTIEFLNKAEHFDIDTMNFYLNNKICFIRKK